MVLTYGYGIQLISGSNREDVKYSDAKDKDLRVHKREPYIQNVRFGSDKGLHEGTTKNVSASGIFIATKEKFKVGQLLKLNLYLKNAKRSEIIGEIVWLNEVKTVLV